MSTPAAGRLDFDRDRLSQGEMIAGVSGIALFLFLFLHWFYGASAWSTFDVVDFVLAAIALLAVAVAVAKAVGSDLLGHNTGLVLAFLGTVAMSMILTFVLEGNGRKIGLWLSFLAAIGILYGGWRILSESVPGLSSFGSRAGGGGGPAPAAGSSAPTTPMAATGAADTPGVPGGGAAGVSPGKEGPGAPHPGTSTGAPGEEGGGPTPASAGADPIPGETAPRTPPGIAGEPPADGGGTQAPGL